MFGVIWAIFGRFGVLMCKLLSLLGAKNTSMHIICNRFALGSNVFLPYRLQKVAFL
jgi:hypothetical protein